ncbi:MAG TPA: phosphatidylserine/phosphatidylglycerophosphate/cardiolipin synthase family protein [Caulobacteraceae bacterium]
MTELELLVGSDAFWRRAAADCARASRRLLVQAMTFEGDTVGQTVASAIGGSPAADRRVLVDAYSRVVVSDRWVAWPGAGPELRREARATDAMFRGLVAGGTGVKVTNPFAPLLGNYPARNHKKLIVADDVAYVGGINFSDHNFAWRDFMVRIQGQKAADFLAADFAATWAGAPRPASKQLDGLRLISLDGRSNHDFFTEAEAMIGAARREIVVMSAYLTFPFTAPLAAAARRGVVVKLITPWSNNKPLVRDYLLSAAETSGFDVRVLPDMSHFKGILIDGARLLVGSCNFDFVGHEAEEELVAVIESEALIEDFRRQVIEPAVADSVALGARRVGSLRGLTAHGVLKLAQLAARAARGARRTAVDWI